MAKESIVTVTGKLSASKPAEGVTRMVRIRSTVEGFRRAGLKHSVAAQDHPAADITDDQYAALTAEPKLIVQVVDIGEEKKPEAGKK